MSILPELGQIALLIALALAALQGVLPLVGAHRGDPAMMSFARPAALAQFGFVLIAFLILVNAFVSNDFSLQYVANNSNSQLPVQFRVAAVWGAHEGSMLLWILILTVWTSAVALRSHSLPLEMASRVLGVLGLLSVGTLLFTLFTSNPFLRLQPAARDGADLNPLLQDPALIIHPPMLYVGYVGLSVAFAFAIAAMLSGQLDRQWARWTRPWVTAAWVFLTLGISLGSWWAYYELGWGGWWFWDPVENASFMPWLAATALFHSLAVTETRGLFKSWTLLLAIMAFSLSLLGTFLVRSGILVSVHAFASDPARGYFILVFLLLVIGVALALYAWRAPSLDTQAGFQATSRETFLLLNNVLLVIAASLILIGTLYPLFVEALGMGKVSVGKEVFELVFIIPMLPLLLLIGIGMHSSWRTGNLASVLRDYRWLIAASLLVGVVGPLLVFGSNSVLTACGIVAALWVMLASAGAPLKLVRQGKPMTRAAAGMHLAHFGVGLFALGATVVSSFGIEADRSIAAGKPVTAAGYTFELKSLEEGQGPNYAFLQGVIEVTRDGEPVATLFPQKRRYRQQESLMTEAGIDGRISRDVFVALGDALGNDAWSVRLQYKPLIRLIWLGTIVMALGGLLAMSDRRYRVHVKAGAAKRTEEAAVVPAVTVTDSA
ncbi:MAG: heme lyase CcmF/NrfE family subunit [Pseudomonadota bacterium]